MSRGVFITFEGGEGAGKSTQIARLSRRLDTKGIAYLSTREPGGSPAAEQVRELLLAPDAAPRSALVESLLFAAARADHVSAVIAPALADGCWVLCDRFSDSTRAYQGAADGVSAETLSALDAIAVGDVKPDLTLSLDLPAEEGLRRARKRAETSVEALGEQDHFELRDHAFHERLRQGFLEIASREPERVMVFDGLLEEDVLDERIWAAVSRRFGLD